MQEVLEAERTAQLERQVDFLVALHNLCTQYLKNGLNVMDIVGAMRVQEARLVNGVDRQFEHQMLARESAKDLNYFG